jgi:hypothetical protein
MKGFNLADVGFTLMGIGQQTITTVNLFSPSSDSATGISRHA